VTVCPRPSVRSAGVGGYCGVEGWMLRERYVLRQLRPLAVEDAGLSFLDRYGSVAGSMWRSLIGVLEREGARDPAALERMCRGAARGFLFAERVLCGGDGGRSEERRVGRGRRAGRARQHRETGGATA